MTMNKITKFGLPEKQGLYDPAFEKDACGVGFVAHIKGQRSHQIVLDANEIMMNMEHRGACGCEANTCLLYTSPSPRDKRQSRMPSSA